VRPAGRELLASDKTKSAVHIIGITVAVCLMVQIRSLFGGILQKKYQLGFLFIPLTTVTMEKG
jgi:hypothetical protein